MLSIKTTAYQINSLHAYYNDLSSSSGAVHDGVNVSMYQAPDFTQILLREQTGHPRMTAVWSGPPGDGTRRPIIAVSVW